MQRVVVIDYGMGNLRSVSKALEHVADGKWQVQVSADIDIIAAADRIVFPGQGAMRDCMGELRAHGLCDIVRKIAAEKPFLGICMGLQVLLEVSAEDPDTPGFGILAGNVNRFPIPHLDPHTGQRLKVPHMGWNQVYTCRDHPLWSAIDNGERFYFVHSYFVQPEQHSIVAAHTDYGVTFASAIAKDNLFAVQFHPEKSQRAGLQLLANFLQWNPA